MCWMCWTTNREYANVEYLANIGILKHNIEIKTNKPCYAYVDNPYTVCFSALTGV